ncbi:hypothetical protein EMCRGX_G031695 [Ephydatia muelleri]
MAAKDSGWLENDLGDDALESDLQNKTPAPLRPEDDVDPRPFQVSYRVSIVKAIFFCFLAALPVCAGFLLAYWFPAHWIRLICSKCRPGRARYVIVTDLDGRHRVEVVQHLMLQEGGLSTPYIVHRNLRYLYTSRSDSFVLLRGYDTGINCNEIHSMIGGLSQSEFNERLHRFGLNSIDVPVKPIYIVLLQEVLHPFYVFQVFCTAIWLAEEYYYYAALIVVMSLLSVVASLLQTRRNMMMLHHLARQICQVTVCRDGQESAGVEGDNLVPGDVIVVPPTGMVMPCDAVLLVGTAIVNEASLTGESVPAAKTSLPRVMEAYLPDKHKCHTLFGGTHVIQTRRSNDSRTLAVVVRTGFMTSKGRMVRSILYPKPFNFKFYWDSVKFILALIFLAGVGFVYSLIVLNVSLYNAEGSVLRAFDVITIAVPPALPAALTVGTVYALRRLRKQQIYCISPQRVNLCGKIKLVCFDKTGTLTEDGMDMRGVMPASKGSISSIINDPYTLPACPLLHGMASCHSLTLINGTLIGDPLDLKIFSSTGWSFEEPGEDTRRIDGIAPPIVRPPKGELESDVQEIGIVKQFAFSSELQCMSVVVKVLPSQDPAQYHLYTKGAPEKVKKMCIPETVPDNFLTVLGSLTQRGMRVLAVGHRPLQKSWKGSPEDIERNSVECNLEFCGLIVMENPLRPESAPVIEMLNEADIRTLMVTGDNLLTALSVARGCGIVQPGLRTILVKAAASQPSNPTVTYHLMAEGEDHSDLLSSMEQQVSFLHPHQDNHVGHSTVMSDFCLVVEGKSFATIRAHCPSVLPKLLVKGAVFARMSPDQKAQLVTDLQDLGYGTSMCGDGANDCGALKAAHAGISLSEAEASVASPFTSKVPNVSCVPKLIMEGRAALTTSFSVFKYMALYSITQFVTASVLYSLESNLGDAQYLYIDVFLIIPFAFVMGLTKPYPKLVRRRPLGTLAGMNVLFPFVVHIGLIIAFQMGGLLILKGRPWFKPIVADPNEDNILSSENTAVVQVSLFQYIGLAVALSTGPPYRRPVYTNPLFTLSLVCLLPFNIYLCLAPAHWFSWLWEQLEFVPHPYLAFRVAILEFAFVYLATTYLLETFVFPSRRLHTLLKFLRCKRHPSNRYKHILASIGPSWPPITRVAGAKASP